MDPVLIQFWIRFSTLVSALHAIVRATHVCLRGSRILSSKMSNCLTQWKDNKAGLSQPPLLTLDHQPHCHDQDPPSNLTRWSLHHSIMPQSRVRPSLPTPPAMQATTHWRSLIKINLSRSSIRKRGEKCRQTQFSSHLFSYLLLLAGTSSMWQDWLLKFSAVTCQEQPDRGWSELL
jgi:hypothetical protein